MKEETYQAQFDRAMKCQTKEEAEQWLKEEVSAYKQDWGKSEEEALGIIRSNLGYMAGYYNHAVAQKVHELFGAVHPIFGISDYHKTVSPEEAFNAGQELAAKQGGEN